MVLSMNWLSDFVDCNDIDIKKYCDRMTDTGSKVEGYELCGNEIERTHIVHRLADGVQANGFERGAVVIGVDEKGVAGGGKALTGGFRQGVNDVVGAAIVVEIIAPMQKALNVGKPELNAEDACACSGHSELASRGDDRAARLAVVCPKTVDAFFKERGDGFDTGNRLFDGTACIKINVGERIDDGIFLAEEFGE